jgi:putative FmdB family regulatory protein
MPFYEYQCKQCGHHLEAMQKVHDAPLKKCPDCGKSALQRLMSAPVFRLKGAGWYETDFKSDQEGKRNLAEKPEAEPVKDDKKDGKDAKDTKEPAAKEATAKEEPKTAAKPTDGAADKSAAKPAANAGASKSSQTTRNIKRAGLGTSSKAKSKKPGKRTARR